MYVHICSCTIQVGKGIPNGQLVTCAEMRKEMILIMEEKVLSWNSKGLNPSSKSVIDFVYITKVLYKFSQHNSRRTETDDLYNL